MLRSSVLICLLLPTLAGASTWSDFTEAFPVFPCSDGWSSCQRESGSLTPDLEPGVEGALRRSTDRLDWSSLDATSGWDPFGELSSYEQPKPPEPEAVVVVIEDTDLVPEEDWARKPGTGLPPDALGAGEPEFPDEEAGGGAEDNNDAVVDAVVVPPEVDEGEPDQPEVEHPVVR